MDPDKNRTIGNQNGVETWADDGIEVPASAVSRGDLIVRVAEEKTREISYIDAVWLEVNGIEILPDGCEDQRWCHPDQRLHRLSEGQSLQLRFSDLPPGPIRLWANGYYTR